MKKLFICITACSAIVMLLLAAVFTILSPLSSSVQEKKIIIESGDTVEIIAAKLYDSGLIRNPSVMITVSKLLFPSYSYKAGEYDIPSNEPLFSLMKKLAIGVPKRELSITIPEGWSIDDIGSALDKQGVFSKDDFLRSSKKDWSAYFPFLIGTAQQRTIEGFLFPDTYRIFVDSTPDDVIRKMLTNFNTKVYVKFGEKADEKGWALYDRVILASIVEREVRTDVDRARVADIFMRRMELGMPLQADSTVNYITGKKSPQSSYNDIAIDSPYNTYRVKGLPPGPICNPGLSSLRAVLYPIRNEYLYFLTAPDGRTVFSKTFQEHVKNKREYLQN
ncbi:MAG: endolytic transglycosylase MltG [Patescibacteria group bacterium]